MHYHFNEGHIQAPAHVTDRTLHVLAPTPGVGGMTIAISRDALEADETPPEFLKRQLGELGRQVGKYQRGEIEAARLGDPAQGIEGSRFTVGYKQQGRNVYHVQAVFLLPGTRQVLSFTFSLPVPFTPEQHRMADEVLASFVLRQPG